eukprot:1148243-Pelagomonas_calceolata.AAC.3
MVAAAIHMHLCALSAPRCLQCLAPCAFNACPHAGGRHPHAPRPPCATAGLGAGAPPAGASTPGTVSGHPVHRQQAKPTHTHTVVRTTEGTITKQGRPATDASASRSSKAYYTAGASHREILDLAVLGRSAKGTFLSLPGLAPSKPTRILLHDYRGTTQHDK